MGGNYHYKMLRNVKLYLQFRIDNIQIFDKDPNALMTSSTVVVEDGVDKPRF